MITTSKFDLEEFRAAVKVVVEDFGPNYIYDSMAETGEPGRCRYVNERDQPSCLISKALFRLGVPIADLLEFDGESSRETLRAVNLPVLTPEAQNWAEVAQRAQDDGDPWGVAVLKADDNEADGLHG